MYQGSKCASVVKTTREIKKNCKTWFTYIIFFRCNGNDVASFYDQNHDSNHRSSMVGQSVLLNLKIGDVIQVSIKNLLVEVSYFSDRNFD